MGGFAVFCVDGAEIRRLLLLGVFVTTLLFTQYSFAEKHENPAEVPPELLARAQILISKGRYEQAFQYLEPYEAVAAGDLHYNYLYGVAALDSGHASEAVFAFQRVLVENPGYSAARMELARAYYELGDYEAARREFEALKVQDPPPLARSAILNYLSSIRRKSARYRPLLSYYVQTGGGYDSNANGATDADIFLNFRLDERNVAKSSAYFEVGYGAAYSHPLNNWTQALLVIGARHRRQPSAEFVDLDRAQGGAGFRYDDDRWLLTSMFVWSYSELEAGYGWDGEYNNSDLGVEFNMRRELNDPYWAFIGNLRLARVDYRKSIGIQDVNQALGSLGYEWTEDGGLYRRIGGVLILGMEDAKESGSPYGRMQYGFRLHGSRKVDNDWWLLANGGLLISDYDGKFFGENRDDRLFHAVGALDWRPFVDPRWSIQPHLSFYYNDSKISLFEYDRVEAGITLKWASE